MSASDKLLTLKSCQQAAGMPGVPTAGQMKAGCCRGQTLQADWAFGCLG